MRPHDGNVIRGNDDMVVLGTSNSPRRHNTNGTIHRGDKKFVWVTVRHAKSKSIQSSNDLDASNVMKLGQHQSATSVENTRYIDASNLEAKVHTCSEKEVVHASTNESADACADIFTGGSGQYGTTSTYDQWMISSANNKIFAPRTTVRQYRPRDSGGSRIISATIGKNERRASRLESLVLWTNTNGVEDDMDGESCCVEVAKISQWKILKKLLS